MTERPIRLTVLGHALVQPEHWGRWRELAESYPVEVRLVVPQEWESGWFGQPVVARPPAMSEGRFRVVPLPTWGRRHWGRYVLRSLAKTLRQDPPDAIIAYGEEFSFLLQQVVGCRKRCCPQARLAFFTWNNLSILSGRRLWLKRLFWRRVCAGTDVAIGGSAEAADLIRTAGYPGSVLVQTELGVDEGDFHPDPAGRERLRQKTGAEGFVFGFAGRLTGAKGVEDLFAALAGASIRQPWTLLLVGDGDLRTSLEAQATQLGGKVVFAGLRPVAEMPDWFRAMDCLVLPSRTMPDWKEQFGLVIPQAMLCGTPVLGSDSGAIPEVVGLPEAVFPERKPAALRRLLERVANDPTWRDQLATSQCKFARQFGTAALAAQTYGWLTDGPLGDGRRA